MKPVICLPEIESIFCDIGLCTDNCISLYQFSESLGNVCDAKDELTHNHSYHVAVISNLNAMAIEIKPRQADVSHIAEYLDDIGKIGIPDGVLKKQVKLTDED